MQNCSTQWNALSHVRYETEDIGVSLERVMRFCQRHVQWSSLADIRMKRVEVKEDGLLFVF